jgi:hypothetical protein
MICGRLMGKGAISMLTTLALVILLLFSMVQPVSIASDTTATDNVKSMILENQYRLVITLGPWSKTVKLSVLGIIIVPPAPGSPENNGEAKYLKLGVALNLSISTDVRLSYENISNEGTVSEGDRIVIESIGTEGLPQGQWQLYLVQESTSGTILGMIWTIGNEPAPDYQLPYSRSSINDPMQHFGFSSQDSQWAFVAIIGSEMILLGVIIYLISRVK